jgi:protein SCO1/2
MFARHKTFRLLLLIISIAALSLAAGALAWRIYSVQKTPVLESLIVLPEARVVADFALIDHQGNAFTLDDFKGRWSLIFFGFTSCPDVCPNTLYQLQQARELMLKEHSEDEIPLIYLVSVDPERDTPEKLSAYLSYFDPAFIGLSGVQEQLAALALQLGIAYFIEPHDPENLEYNVDHSASMLLLDPQGRLYGVLPAPIEAAKTARDIMTVIR